MSGTAIFLLGTLGVGGSERKFVRLANALAGRGRPVHLAWLGGPETLLGEIEPDVAVSPLHRRGKYSLPALARLRRLLRRCRPCAVVNVNFYPLAYSVPARALVGSGIRLFASINTTDLPGTREARFMALYAPLLRHMDEVVFGAHAQAAAWQSAFRLDPRRLGVVHNGVDTERFKPPGEAERASARAALSLPAAVPVAVCVAQLRPEKAHMDLLDAFAGCGVGEARLVLAGDGPMRAALEAHVSRLGLGARVTFAGEVADVRPYLAAADLFVLSSVAVETFSNAALEAAASGLPVVLTDIGGARELVEDGTTGLVVPRSDPAALAEALGSLFSDPVRCVRMGRSGRTRTVESFAFSRMLDDWTTLLWQDGAVTPPQRALA